MSPRRQIVRTARPVTAKPTSALETFRLADAKRFGFLVTDAMSRGSRGPYWDWCRERNVPAIEVKLGNKFATVDYNADPTGYPYTCNPGVQIEERFKALVWEHVAAEDHSLVPGEHEMVATGLPHDAAFLVAAQLWAWVKPFCVMTAAQRDAYRRDAYLGRLPVRIRPSTPEPSMTSDQLYTRIRAVPFVPFVIRVADGKEVEVRHPELIAYSGGRIAVVMRADQTVEIIDLLLAPVIEVRPAALQGGG